MESLPTVEELKRWRDAYNEHVRRWVESQDGTFIDKAISAPGARYILETLENQATEYVVDRFRRGTVLDMGTGFSTLFVGIYWCQRHSWRYVAVEHDKMWLRFMRGLLRAGPAPFEPDGPFSRGEDGRPNRAMTFFTRAAWEEAYRSGHSSVCKGPFEAIIVDQNPSLDTRAQDTPRLSTALSETGVILFDDWRPKHEGRIRRALEKAPGKWIIGSGGDGLKRSPRDKTIGWARRDLS